MSDPEEEPHIYITLAPYADIRVMYWRRRLSWRERIVNRLWSLVKRVAGTVRL